MALSTFAFFRQFPPNAPAVYIPDAQTAPSTYAQFRGMIAQTVRRLLDAGLAKGDVVALELSNEFLHALLLVACARIGVATLSGSPSTVQVHVPVKAVFRDRSLPATGPSIQVISVDESWSRVDDESGSTVLSSCLGFGRTGRR